MPGPGLSGNRSRRPLLMNRYCSWRADAAVVSEPTEHGLMLSHRGFVWADVDILGKAGHGSRPDLGVDAIVKVGDFLLRVALEKYGQDLIAGRVQGSAVSVHPKVGTGTVHAGTIRSGEELTSYPALQCTASVARRIVTGTPCAWASPGRATRLLKVIRSSGCSSFERHAQPPILSQKPTALAGTYWTDR